MKKYFYFPEITAVAEFHGFLKDSEFTEFSQVSPDVKF
jgi:hypothetical protein